MDTLKKIQSALLLQIEKLKSDNDYWESDEYNDTQVIIFDGLKDNFGFDWEDDDKALEYFLRATGEEACEYTLANILPRLELKTFIIKYTNRKTKETNYVKTWAKSKLVALRDFCLLECKNVPNLILNAREVDQKLSGVRESILFNHLFIEKS